MKTRANKTKKVIIAAALVLGSLSPALATYHHALRFHDDMGVNGRPRSHAVLESASDDCYDQVGLPQNADATPAYKACMKTKGYSFISSKIVQGPPAKTPASKLGKNQFIDPDTGLLCTHGGWAAFCETPPADMTIRYTDEDGLSCKRTGGVAICSSFFTPD